MKLSKLVKTPLNVALQKTDVVKSFVVRVILTSKNEKLSLLSKSKVHFIFLRLEFM